MEDQQQDVSAAPVHIPQFSGKQRVLTTASKITCEEVRTMHTIYTFWQHFPEKGAYVKKNNLTFCSCGLNIQRM